MGLLKIYQLENERGPDLLLSGYTGKYDDKLHRSEFTARVLSLLASSCQISILEIKFDLIRQSEINSRAI